MTIAIKGKTPTPKSWKPALETFLEGTGGITLLEKQVGHTTLQDIAKALDEYYRLYKAGIASKAEILTLSRAFPDDPTLSKEAAGITESPIVIGGPASVEMVDREGHLITTDALSKAFDNYMGNFRTRNTMVLHSDVQVGWALPAYISQGGQIFKSGVDGNGLFFITEIRDDTRIAHKVMEQINEGKLKSYSIAGSAVKVQNMMKGLTPYMQVDDLELAEVTVCEKGVNQGAGFDLLKGNDSATQSCADGSCLIKGCDEHPMIGHQTGQLSPDQVNYRPATEMEKNAGIMCGTCRFFNHGMSTCDLVTGVFAASDWCSLFDPMDSSPVLENENNVREIMLMRKENGNIDFAGTFLNWMEKLSTVPGIGGIDGTVAASRDLTNPGWRRGEDRDGNEDKDVKKGTDHSHPRKKAPLNILRDIVSKADAGKKGGLASLMNHGGREAEHHQLLREYGFPSEVPPEAARYIPVVEIETDDCGCPINIKPPWTVNEAGQEVGEHSSEEALNKSDSFLSWVEKAGIWSPRLGGGLRRMRQKVDPGKHAALGKPPRSKPGFRAF